MLDVVLPPAAAHLPPSLLLPLSTALSTPLSSIRSETSNSMYHLAEVRWQQGQREQAATLMAQSLEIMQSQVRGGREGERQPL